MDELFRGARNRGLDQTPNTGSGYNPYHLNDPGSSSDLARKSGTLNAIIKNEQFATIEEEEEDMLSFSQKVSRKARKFLSLKVSESWFFDKYHGC